MSNPGKIRKLLYLLDALIIACMGILLYCGASWEVFQPNTDVAKYQCYAAAFLHGMPVVTSYPSSQCDFLFSKDGQGLANAQIANRLRMHGAPSFLVNFVMSQDLFHQFHALPHEYPLLALIPFLLVFFSPQPWYQVSFALVMIALAAGMYLLLARYKSRKAALAGAALLVLGGWATVAGRFDLVPSLLTLGAVILAERKRWHWAFVMLAVAFLIKFYPAILLIPFLLAQQMDSQRKWYAWRRWQPLALFLGVCVLVMGVSLLLSIEGTIWPLSYFQKRPLQVESFGSSVLWLSTLLKQHPLTFDFQYGSVNVRYVYSSRIARAETVLLVISLLYTVWLQWRGKIGLAPSVLLILLIVIVTGKVFSPQYLIWVVPLVAYVGSADLRWVVSWATIGGLTTFIYPFIYSMPAAHAPVDAPLVPWFYPVITLRNFILFGFVLAVLISWSRRQFMSDSAVENAVEQIKSDELDIVTVQQETKPAQHLADICDSYLLDEK